MVIFEKSLLSKTKRLMNLVACPMLLFKKHLMQPWHMKIVVQVNF